MLTVEQSARLLHEIFPAYPELQPHPPAVTCKKEEVPSRGIPHRMFVVKDVAVCALYQADFNGVVQLLVDFEGGAQ